MKDCLPKDRFTSHISYYVLGVCQLGGEGLPAHYYFKHNVMHVHAKQVYY